MPLSSRVKNKLMDNINMMFDDIGYLSGTRMPKSSRNNEPAAWKLFIAHHLVSRANKLKDQAEAEAIKDGVIFDKQKNPRPEGTREVVYNGDIVKVLVEVRKASERVDVSLFVDALHLAGVKNEVIDRCLGQSTRTTRPAHVFTTILTTEEANGK